MSRVGNRQVKTLLILVAAMIAVACLAMALTAAGSGLALWLAVAPTQTVPAFTPKPTFTATPSPLPPTPTIEIFPTQTPLPPSATPTPTPVPSPTGTPTATPSPASPTPIQELLADTPVPETPTAAPEPTFTPSLTYTFSMLETDQFPTGHDNFDVYIAVTDHNNKPLASYRVIATHSTGRQEDSQESAGDWTVNSGAMHYKAGNIKYEISDSPSGIWTLKLVDANGTEVAPPLELAYDPMNPTWYFILYQQVDGSGDTP